MLNETEKRFYDLAASFPSIARWLPPLSSLGIINPVLDKLRELTQPLHGTGMIAAAEFLLSLFDGRKIDMRVAWAYWDNEHRAAWQAWARSPWWV